jgi:hemerythrin-like metal-binding protein
MIQPPSPDTVTWSDEFLTGFEAVDRQHRILVETTARLAQASPGQDERLALRRVLRELVDYTLYHFAMEERLMKQHGYGTHDPAAWEAHLQQHQGFVEKVLAWQQGLERGEPLSIHELQGYLMGWIANHILHHDRKLTDYLSSRGVKE